MGLAELILLALAVAMDAFAVSICKGLAVSKATFRESLICGIWFGGFQGLMPFIGYLLGSGFANLIDRIAAWIAFALLLVLGINMLREAFSGEEEESRPGFGIKTMFLMAVATSIDALAVGITFVAVPMRVCGSNDLINVTCACAVIAVITGVISALGVRIGNKFGMRYKSGAEAAGGFILIFIGLKILLEYLGVIDFMSSGDVLFGLLIPFAGSVIGSALVFVIKDSLHVGFKNILTGLSGGIMMACAMWSLLSPTLNSGRLQTAFTGFLIGILFQYILDKAVPHTHIFTDSEEGPKSRLGLPGKVVLSEIIHHVPEGMAVGIMYAGFLNGRGEITLTAATALATGIAIQNMPEGAFVSSPLKDRGEEKGKSFLMGVVSGIIEPMIGILTIIVVGFFPDTLSFIMALSAGAITFLVLEETIPSMSHGKHSDKGVLSFSVFFALMMLIIFFAQSRA